MLQEGMNATELRLDRSALVVNCSAAPNIKREYECMTGDPEVGCSTSSCRETPVPPSCLNAPEGLVRRKRSRLLTHVDWSRIGDNSPGIHFLSNSGKRLTSQIVYFVTIPAWEVDNL